MRAETDLPGSGAGLGWTDSEERKPRTGERKREVKGDAVACTIPAGTAVPASLLAARALVGELGTIAEQRGEIISQKVVKVLVVFCIPSVSSRQVGDLHSVILWMNLGMTPLMVYYTLLPLRPSSLTPCPGILNVSISLHP